MSKYKHIQDYASPTEASKQKRDWNDSEYQSSKNGNDSCNTRQDEDKHGSHIHYQLTKEDNKTRFLWTD